MCNKDRWIVSMLRLCLHLIKDKDNSNILKTEDEGIYYFEKGDYKIELWYNLDDELVEEKWLKKDMLHRKEYPAVIRNIVIGKISGEPFVPDNFMNNPISYNENELILEYYINNELIYEFKYDINEFIVNYIAYKYENKKNGIKKLIKYKRDREFIEKTKIMYHEKVKLLTINSCKEVPFLLRHISKVLTY